MTQDASRDACGLSMARVDFRTLQEGLQKKSSFDSFRWLVMLMLSLNSLAAARWYLWRRKKLLPPSRSSVYGSHPSECVRCGSLTVAQAVAPRKFAEKIPGKYIVAWSCIWRLFCALVDAEKPQQKWGFRRSARD